MQCAEARENSAYDYPEKAGLASLQNAEALEIQPNSLNVARPYTNPKAKSMALLMPTDA